MIYKPTTREELNSLPKGDWIAGTIPYFMGPDGGVFSQEQIYVTELPDFISSFTIRTYQETDIHKVYSDAPANGFGVIIIPASCPTHLAFALKGPSFPNFATSPLVGWIFLQ